MTERERPGSDDTNADPETDTERKSDEPKVDSLRIRYLRRLQRAQFYAYTTLLVLLLFLGVLWRRVFISVPAGSHAVMYRFFKSGTVTNRIWTEGLNIIPPWDHLTIYETRLQNQTLQFDVLSEEGLGLDVKVSIRYRPNKEMLGFLHQDIGVDYFERLIKPEVQSHVRRTFGTRPAHEIYSSTRDILQELGQIPVLGRLEEGEGSGLTSHPYVVIQELKLLGIELPPIVQAAIADKYKQEQLMLEYRYKLDREDKEAERKRTEAAGIRDYNLIVAKVNPDLLRWRTIEASLELAHSQIELAKSPNSKVVVLGGGPGAQMLLNVDSPAPAPTAADVAPTAADIAKPQVGPPGAASAEAPPPAPEPAKPREPAPAAAPVPPVPPT